MGNATMDERGQYGYEISWK
uniref:Uncharacterized protein n=1 Tax=Arundo donax TaxID=35708 RepID=A0A0A8YB43_ARUDO